MSHLSSFWGVNSWSIFKLQLFDLNLGSTPSLALVPSMSQLSLLWGQLQIHICVVLFDLNFHCIDIMLTLCYLQNSIFYATTLFLVVIFEKIGSQTGAISSRWSFWVPTTVCYLQNWMFCPLTLFQVIRIEKFLPKQGSFFRPLFRVPIVLCYLQNWTFHPIFVYLNIICSMTT